MFRGEAAARPLRPEHPNQQAPGNWFEQYSHSPIEGSPAGNTEDGCAGPFRCEILRKLEDLETTSHPPRPNARQSCHSPLAEVGGHVFVICGGRNQFANCLVDLLDIGFVVEQASPKIDLAEDRAP